MKELVSLMKSLRPDISVRFDFLEYIASNANAQSSNYEYFVTRENIKRIDKNGNIEIVLATSQNRAKANYFFELESFTSRGYEEKYKNLEEYYEKNGYDSIGWRLSLGRRKKALKKKEKVVINLTALDKETLQKRADSEGLSLSQLCRKALRESGVLR